jgi:hypothetical protein
VQYALVRQVRVAEFNESTSFREQLEAVSGTGVYVSVHTSNLVSRQPRQSASVLPVNLLGRLQLFWWREAGRLSPPNGCCLRAPRRPMRRSCGRAQRRWSSSSATGCGTAWTRASRWLLLFLGRTHHKTFCCA